MHKLKVYNYFNAENYLHACSLENQGLEDKNMCYGALKKYDRVFNSDFYFLPKR
jgi:hypothetical protein